MHLISTYNSSVGGNTAGSEKWLQKEEGSEERTKEKQADHRLLTSSRLIKQSRAFSLVGVPPIREERCILYWDI